MYVYSTSQSPESHWGNSGSEFPKNPPGSGRNIDSLENLEFKLLAESSVYEACGNETDRATPEAVTSPLYMKDRLSNMVGSISSPDSLIEVYMSAIRLFP